MNLVKPPQRDTMLLYWAASLAMDTGRVIEHLQAVYASPELDLKRVRHEIGVLKSFVAFLEEKVQARIDEPEGNEPHRSAL
jgi:hypothetical protein